MSKPKIFNVTAVIIFIWVLINTVQAFAACAEPALSDYTVYPIFQVNSVDPNILLIVDNSGSMNRRAYACASRA